eukprot:757234-Hanusia_phi.AAC.2
MTTSLRIVARPGIPVRAKRNQTQRFALLLVDSSRSLDRSQGRGVVLEKRETEHEEWSGVETRRVESRRVETRRVETRRDDWSGVEWSGVEWSGVESSLVESGRVESSRVESSRGDRRVQAMVGVRFSSTECNIGEDRRGDGGEII